MIILLGNMLFPDHSRLPVGTPVFMAEDRGLCTHFKYHKHKLILYLAAMRHHRDTLRAQGVQVEYHELTARNQTLSYEDKLAQGVQKFRANKIDTYTIEGHFFRKRIESFCQAQKLELHQHDSPLFLTTTRQFQEYRSRYKRLFMADFYKLQRQRLGILISADNKPAGGKWSFDEQNRQALPSSLNVPKLQLAEPTQHTQAVSKLVDQLFPDHSGQTEDFWLPVTREGALEWLEAFLRDRFAQFGPYEDALSTGEPFVFHSIISPLQNIGLLTPQEVVSAALDHAANHDIPLNSLEGFVRQIIGWREYIRGVYQEIGEAQGNSNTFGHERQLTDAWYAGTTGLPPVDLVIRQVQRRGWAHHIERLMVISNIMLLANVHPDEVYRWFMELFVDSSDWVMVPNVYGMGQFADGGLMVTKPYISSSNYLLKMGNFQKGDWCDIWDGLYWRFVDQKRETLSQNPRTKMMLRTFERMNQPRKQKILTAAEAFIQTKTRADSISLGDRDNITHQTTAK